jgi:hypothetical protein
VKPVYPPTTSLRGYKNNVQCPNLNIIESNLP